MSQVILCDVEDELEMDDEDWAILDSWKRERPTPPVQPKKVQPKDDPLVDLGGSD